MKTKNHLYVPIYTCLVAIMALYLSSCGNEYSWSSVPMLNKSSVTVTGKTDKDTIYSTNGVSCKMKGLKIVRNEKRIASFDMDNGKDNDIKDGEQTIGRIEYKNGEISMVEIFDWCILTVVKKQKEYTYVIEAKGGKVPSTEMYLGIPGQSALIK